MIIKKPKRFFLLVTFFITLGFFWPILKNKLPIPADTVLGLYHPWRDQAWREFVNYPFKNFLITDPVRQSYVYKQEAIKQIKSGQLPLWNSKILSGTPLLASFQAGVFYPLNLVLFLGSFKWAWSFFIVLQPVLAVWFMWLYLSRFKIKPIVKSFLSLTWAFSGFMVAWMTWGNIGHTAMWLPLALYLVDNIIYTKNNKKADIKAYLGYIFVIASSFFAGHSQTALYLITFSTLYFIGLYLSKKLSSKKLLKLATSTLISLIITSAQWLPTLKLTLSSARGQDLPLKGKIGWFLPWQNLLQLWAPDFFGNPATQNYWGVWNYGEMVSYIGIVSVFMAIYGLIYSKRKLKIGLVLALISSLILAIKNPISKLFLAMPVVGSFQPTRLVFIIIFVLIVLAALGAEAIQKSFKPKKIFFAWIFSFGLILFSWVATQNPSWFSDLNLEPVLKVSQRNLVLPTLEFFGLTFFIFIYWALKNKKRLKHLSWLVLWLVTVFSFYRFFHKFTPFVSQDLVFPQTKSTEYLKTHTKDYPWRVMGVDYLANQKRVLIPNLNMAYNLAVPGGYEPLYLKRYGELVSAWEIGDPEIGLLSFNRSLLPNNYKSKITNFLGVKYFLTLKDYQDDSLKLIDQAGETRVYENLQVQSRAFLISQYQVAKSKKEALKMIFDPEVNLSKTVILESDPGLDKTDSFQGKAEILSYQPNLVKIKTQTNQDSILVLSDSWYPSWSAKVDNKNVKIYKANYNFRAVVVPKGEHLVEFKNSLF